MPGAAIDLPGARQPGPHVTVPVSIPPSCSPWPGSASRLTWPASHDRARTYPASVLHRPAGPPAPRQPAHHRRLPCDTWRLLLAFASGQGEKQPCQLDLNDLDAPLIGAFLDHLERDRGQQSPDPQRPARRDLLAVPLRSAAPPRARRGDRPRPGHPAQAIRQGPGHLRRPARALPLRCPHLRPNPPSGPA